MDIIDLTRFWIVSWKRCNSPWITTNFLGRSLLLVIRCQVMAFSQLVAFHWAIAWCHRKLKTDLPPYEPVVFASPPAVGHHPLPAQWLWFVSWEPMTICFSCLKPGQEFCESRCDRCPGLLEQRLARGQRSLEILPCRSWAKAGIWQL